MIFQGQAIQIARIEDDLAHLQIDLKDESVNKFNLLTSAELADAITALENEPNVKALVISSAKSVFIVGADISEFGPVFAQGEQAVADHLAKNNDTFNRLEDLPFPTVVAVNGFALGGGLELCLACDYRVLSTDARIGLPETKLGIIPGWGGTVRLPRLAGADVAIEWIASGADHKPELALKAGVADGVVAPEQLLQSAKDVALRAASGKLDYKRKRQQKQSPLGHNDTEALLAFESSKMFVRSQAGRNYPAPSAAVEVMQQAAKLGREEALKIETQRFTQLSATPAARSLVGLFLSDQLLGKKAKTWAKQSKLAVQRAAVLGAGIMGGGIAYQSALKKVPVKMKDIAQAGLDLGLKEASNLLSKRVERNKLSVADMAATLTRIEPCLSFDGFDQVDIVVEAVVENPKVKKSVLAEVEQKIKPEAILASNTSTISINELAEGLQRPENFCGMHFFNPVHAMPLVEVIRGEKTSEQAVAATVAYANTLGKKAVVVNNCPGFLVNRVLFPYFAGFAMLLRDGADFQVVDKTMERFGWPMGPAYLLDVVGIDTGVHAEAVMAEGFPSRMSKTFKTATDILFEAKRYGQKNSAGFYDYVPDKKGKPSKVPCEEVSQLLASHCAPIKDFDADEIVARMMVPMATEMARCLEEGIVESAAEADMALIYGLGFPPFRGGVFRWLDEIGLHTFIEMAKPLAELGELYSPTQGMLDRAAANETYYKL